MNFGALAATGIGAADPDESPGDAYAAGCARITHGQYSGFINGVYVRKAKQCNTFTKVVMGYIHHRADGTRVWANEDFLPAEGFLKSTSLESCEHESWPLNAVNNAEAVNAEAINNANNVDEDDEDDNSDEDEDDDSDEGSDVDEPYDNPVWEFLEAFKITIQSIPQRFRWTEVKETTEAYSYQDDPTHCGKAAGAAFALQYMRTRRPEQTNPSKEAVQTITNAVRRLLSL